MLNKGVSQTPSRIKSIEETRDLCGRVLGLFVLFRERDIVQTQAVRQLLWFSSLFFFKHFAYLIMYVRGYISK